jgi:hypothetical protein
MKSFDERQKGFEAEFVRGQELSFRIRARRNRLLGLWAAERLGLPAGESTEAYARSVVVADLQVPGEADVVEKVVADLAAKGVKITEADVRAELTRANKQAREQLTGR